MGGLFALAFAFAYGRVGRASPARTALWLAAGAFVVVYLVPFLKYPANPPSVGDPDTIGKRTELYLAMIVCSLLAAVAALRIRAWLAERRDATTATVVAGLSYLAVVVAAGLILPGHPRGPEELPGDHAVALPRGLDRHAGGAVDDDRRDLLGRRASASWRASPSSGDARGRPGWSPRRATDRRAVLVLLSTADTEILAAAHAVRDLPEGFGPVRCANPYGVEDVDAFLDDLLDERSGRRRPPARRPPGVAGGRRRAAVALRARRRGAPAAGRRGRARRRAGRALERAGGDAGPGLRVPAPRRRGEHGQPAALPGRHAAARGPRLRAAARAPRPRGLRARARRRRARGGRRRPRPGAPDGRPRLLPLAPRDREHRLRRRAGGGARRGGRRRAVRVGLLAAAGRRRARGRTRALARAHRRARHDGAGLGGVDRGGRRGRRPRRLEHLARRRAGRARRAGDPGGVRDEQPRRVGGVAGGADAARRRDAGRDPRVRRAHRRAAGELQGAARGRVAGGDARPALRARPRALRAPGAARRRPRAAARADPADARIAIVLSSFPTKHARIGNAVGLDTPASAIALLERLRAAGYAVEHDFADGDELIHALIAAGGHDHDFLTDEQLAAATGRLPVAEYEAWFATLPAAAARGDDRQVGPAAGRVVRRRRRTSCSPACSSATSSSPSSRRAASGRTPWRSTTTPSWRRRTTTWPPTTGCAPSCAPTRSSISASTARSSGCRARASGSVPRARPTPRWPACRSSTPSSSTTPARACRPSAARAP